MTSSESFYLDKSSDTARKIKNYERKKKKERRAKIATDLYILRQRKVAKSLIIERFGISSRMYDTLLREGREHYEKHKK